MTARSVYRGRSTSLSGQEPAVAPGGEDGPRSRRSLLYATTVLLVLMLVMSAAAHIVQLRPAALVGFPIMIIGATALILILLYLAGPKPGEPGVVEAADTVVRSALVPAVAVDAHSGRILAVNAEASGMVGPARLTIGSHFSDLFGSGGPDDCRRIYETAAEFGEGEVDTCTMRTHTGDPVVVRLIARMHRPVDGEGPEFVIVGLERNEASDAIAQFARVQERLMSNISHELRTPLNVVMGFSELLTTGTLGEMPYNQLDAAQECHEGGERILRLINDILDVGRSRSYYLAGEQRPISPVEMIRRMENLLAGQARRESLQLEMKVEPGLPAIVTEERAFKQLVYHLILSSMDRSEPGGAVRIAARDEGDELVLTVTDSGPEISEPIRPGHVPDVSDEGARDTLAPPLLGLPLCAFLAERLGSTLTVATDQEGVHFGVKLPHERP